MSEGNVFDAIRMCSYHVADKVKFVTTTLGTSHLIFLTQPFNCRWSQFSHHHLLRGSCFWLASCFRWTPTFHWGKIIVECVKVRSPWTCCMGCCAFCNCVGSMAYLSNLRSHKISSLHKSQIAHDNLAFSCKSARMKRNSLAPLNYPGLEGFAFQSTEAPTHLAWPLFTATESHIWWHWPLSFKLEISLYIPARCLVWVRDIPWVICCA